MGQVGPTTAGRLRIYGANIHGCDNKVVTIHNAGRSRAYHYLTEDAVVAWHGAIGLTVFLRVAKNTKPTVLIQMEESSNIDS